MEREARRGEPPPEETEFKQYLREGRTQDMLFWATARVAPCQFAVNYNCGDAAHAVMLRFGCHLGRVHAVDHYLMRRTIYLLDELDSFLAC